MAVSASLPRAPKSSARRVRIALLAAYLHDEYEWEIFRGACEAMDEVGGTVVCFAGAGLGDPDPSHQARQFVFDLVSAHSVDAVLSISSVLGHVVGPSEIGTWLRRYGLPVAGIGPAHGVPSVQVSDAAGTARLVEHLILHHAHRRIAFLSGPATNVEAQHRLSGYSRALDEHGLDYDTKLVLHGQFTRESGVHAVHELFDRRQVRVSEVDAIVAANDYMAFGVIDELVRRRIGVPEQVAVVGFDDIAPARSHEPRLTTVRQPLRELGREGVRKLLSMLNGSTSERTTSLDTELVLRRSCGCTPTEIPAAPPWGAESLRPFESELPEPQTELPLVGTEHALDLHDDLVYERLYRFQRALGNRMFGPTVELSTVLAEHLPELGVNECAVSEFSNKANKDSLRLSFGFDAENLRPQHAVFAAKELFPNAFSHLRSSSIVVLPVTHGEQALGVAALPASIPSGQLCEILAESFGVALKSIELRRRADSK